MQPQQHLYNGLNCPADYSILYGNGLTHMDSMLAYSHRGWPMASMLAYSHRGWPMASMLAAQLAVVA